MKTICVYLLCVYLLAATVVQAAESSTRIAVSFQNEGRSGIYVVNADGTGQQRLTKASSDTLPRWSSDGQQIAFCSNRDGNMDIFVMDSDGSSVKQLSNDAGEDLNPIWSPDGKQIAFTSYRKRDGGSVYVVNADGTRESWLPVSGSPVAWSPDGKTLLVANDRQIAISGADGRNQKEMTKAGDRALDGEYSRDGNAVLYRSKVNGKWMITSVEIERLSRKRIWSDTGIVSSFSVSPLQRDSSE